MIDSPSPSPSPLCSLLSLNIIYMYLYVHHFQFVIVCVCVCPLFNLADLVGAFVYYVPCHFPRWAPAIVAKTTDCLNNHFIFTIRGKWISPIWALCVVHRFSIFSNHSWAQIRNSFQKFTFHMHTSSLLTVACRLLDIQYSDATYALTCKKSFSNINLILLLRTLWIDILLSNFGMKYILSFQCLAPNRSEKWNM